MDGAHKAQLDLPRPVFPIDEVDEFTFVAHKLTGTVHVVKDDQTGKLACGRRRNDQHGVSRGGEHRCIHSILLYPMQCRDEDVSASHRSSKRDSSTFSRFESVSMNFSDKLLKRHVSIHLQTQFTNEIGVGRFFVEFSANQRNDHIHAERSSLGANERARWHTVPRYSTR